MKKIIAMLLALVLALSLVACGKDEEETKASNESTSSSAQTSESASSSAQTSESTTKAESTEPETSAADGKVKKDDAGDGPATLKSNLIEADVPKGLNYKVSSYTIYDTNPLYGNIMIMLKNAKGMVAAKINASSQNMVTSQKEAVEKVISLCNLGSYKEGKSSVKDGVKYGKNTYSLVKISTENYQKDYFVTYVDKRSSTDEKGLMVYLEVDLKQIASDDPMIEEVLSSIKVVKA